MKTLRVLFLFLLLLAIPLAAQDTKVEMLLMSPEWNSGVLTTEEGGSVIGTDFLIQARMFTITKKPEENIFHISARGDLFFRMGNRCFRGENLEYDMVENCGVIEKPVLLEGKWLLSGDMGYFSSDGGFCLLGASLTTSLSERPEWQIKTDALEITPCEELIADNLSLKLGDYSLFSLPPIRLHLEALSTHPFRYYAKWGGHEGPRTGVMYEFFSDPEKRLLGRVDYRLKGGLGGGLEAHYRSANTCYQGTNYIARDFEIDNPKTRYRFQGVFNNRSEDDKTNIFLSYDKISDSDMPADYKDKGIFIENAEKTELIARKEVPWGIFLFATRVRVNSFETVKQELPSLECYLKPFQLRNWIFENRVKGCFLDYVYANSLRRSAKDYQALRILGEHRQLFPFSTGPFNHLITLDEHSLYYTKTPGGGENWTGLFLAGLKSSLLFQKKYSRFSHVVEPYIDSKYATFPSTPPNRHYIFDIDDGIYRLHMVKFGIWQNFLKPSECEWLESPLSIDLYSIAFPDTGTFPATVPNAYCDIKWLPLKTLRFRASLNWNLYKSTPDALLTSLQWTINENHAVSIEWRGRSHRVLRKADPTNYFLESYRPFRELEDSPLSDRRDIILARGFWRFHPLFSLQWEMRSGWNRILEPAWREVGIEVVGRLPGYWNVIFAYQKRQGRDNRFSVSLYLDLEQPRPKCISDTCILE